MYLPFCSCVIHLTGVNPQVILITRSKLKQDVKFWCELLQDSEKIFPPAKLRSRVMMIELQALCSSLYYFLVFFTLASLNGRRHSLFTFTLG